MKAYCAFCRSGAEHLAAKSVECNYPDIQAIAPCKMIQEKRQGQWIERSRILLPGYIFLYSEDDLPCDIFIKSNHLYKILQYEKGIRMLSGGDAAYADWVLRHHGKIEPSKYLQVGSTMEVIDGPLADCSGKIVRIDKHKRRVWIEFDFDDQKRIISVGAECLNSSGISETTE